MSSRWKIILWIIGAAGLVFFAVVIIAYVEISRNGRSWANNWLEHEYNSKVEFSSFHVSTSFPLVQGEGENLVLHFNGRQDLPPLILVRRFTFRASIWEVFRVPRHISFVRLEGLQINIPPREDQGSTGEVKRTARRVRDLRFGEIHAENASLKILTHRLGKDPLEFDLKQLDLSSRTNGALAFHTTLSNPKPPGEIASTGTFGPWNADFPSQSPVSGRYIFNQADLSVFPGIAGTLSSQGDYQGVLDKIGVDGTTDTPDFRVTRAGHSTDLSTTFHATVDGVNGDTFLHSVEAHFGKTTLLAQGKIEGTMGKKGKTITLDVSTDHGAIEDLLHLVMKGPATMRGPIHLHTKFFLAPGPQEIPDRIKLGGSFALDSVHFTNSATQQKLDNLSKRSQGEPKEIIDPTNAISTDDVATAMKGNFRLDDGMFTFSGLGFRIPGADAHLAGTFALQPELLDLYGTLTLQAKLSQTTTGIKSFLLKLVDPFFSKGRNGTVLPIKITGSVQHPRYSLDFHRKG